MLRQSWSNKQLEGNPLTSQSDAHTHTPTHKHTETHTETHTHRQTDRQTDTHTHKLTLHSINQVFTRLHKQMVRFITLFM